MKNQKTLLILVLVLALLIGGAYALYQSLADQVDTNQLSTQPPATTIPETTGMEPAETSSAQAETISPAPDFTVYDPDGNPVNLSDFRGKPVIVNFWASTCGYCVKEMPDFEQAYQAYGDRIHFLMVNITDGSWDTLDTAKAFMAGTDYTFPVYFDTDQDAAAVFGIYSLPMTFFFDATGYGVAYARGALDAATLQKGIDMLLPQ